MFKAIFSTILTGLTLFGGLHLFAFWVDNQMNSVTPNNVEKITSEISAFHSSLMIHLEE